MPLNVSLLKDNILDVIIDYPNDIIEASEKWANAFDLYAKQVVPLSTTSEASKIQFKSVFININNTNGKELFSQSFIAYCDSLATGMQPLFTSTPPSAPLDFEPVYALGLSKGTHEQIADLMSTIIDTWIRTGVAVNNSSSVSTPWT